MLHTGDTFQLLDWIDASKLSYKILSINPHPHAIHLLEQHPDKIDWVNLSRNRSAMHLLEQHPDKINWFNLSINPSAMHMLKQHPDKIDWENLSRNPAANHLFELNSGTHLQAYWDFISRYGDICMIEHHLHSVEAVAKIITAINSRCDLLEADVEVQIGEHTLNVVSGPLYVPTDRLNWSILSARPSAIHLFETYPDKLIWASLCYNQSPIAIRMLEEKYKTCPECIHWSNLSSNLSYDAMRFLEQHPEHIDWDYLSRNPFAKHLLEKYPEHIVWRALASNHSMWAIEKIQKQFQENPIDLTYIHLFVTDNPRIFTWNTAYDYESMKQHKLALHEDLLRRMLHPDNLSKCAGWGIECGWDHDET
jgi:hypothetical protein